LVRRAGLLSSSVWLLLLGRSFLSVMLPGAGRFESDPVAWEFFVDARFVPNLAAVVQDSVKQIGIFFQLLVVEPNSDQLVLLAFNSLHVRIMYRS
jgi:hypothetical protein